MLKPGNSTCEGTRLLICSRTLGVRLPTEQPPSKMPGDWVGRKSTKSLDFTTQEFTEDLIRECFSREKRKAVCSWSGTEKEQGGVVLTGNSRNTGPKGRLSHSKFPRRIQVLRPTIYCSVTSDTVQTVWSNFSPLGIPSLKTEIKY